jgi:Zn-dependent protease with chaperone function/Flp pilus assembly protein TadD
MNGGWLRVLVIGSIVGGLMLVNLIADRTDFASAPQPRGGSDSGSSNQMPPTSEPLQPKNKPAAQQIINEGDRLASQGRLQEAIDYYTAALALAPRDAALYGKRFALYQQIGESTLADRDRQLVSALAAYRDLENRATIDFSFGDGLSINTLQDAVVWGGGAWLLLSLAYCGVGYRQSREGGGTIRRLVGVAGGAALIALLPLFVWMAVQAIHHVGFVETTETLLLTGLSGVWMALVLRPPHRPYANRPPLPLVEDESLLARVKSLATAMRIAPPRVRLVRSVGGAQRVLAWAGGLPKPTILVTDGLLSRLDERERDAVLAHEMGHIANHSLWPLASLFSVSCAVAVLIAIGHPLSVASAFWFAVMMGLRRIISRQIEADCDRRAARVIGFGDTIAALKKIHALHPIKTTGWRSLIGYAWATHPSPEVRLSLLRRAAKREEADASASVPVDEITNHAKKELEFANDSRRFRLHRAISWFGVILWIGALCLALRLSLVSESAAFWLLVAVTFVPNLLLASARTAAAQRARARQRLRPAWLGLVIVSGIVALVYAPFFIDAVSGPNAIGVAIFSPLVVAVVFTAIVASSRRGQGVGRQIAEAMQDHRFDVVLEIGRKNRNQIAKNPSARYSIAFVEALRGDRAFAVAELEDMRKKHRSFALPSLTLFALYYEAGELENALEVARTAARRWAKDPEFLLSQAKVLRRLGRLDEAQAAIETALTIDSSEGGSYAVAAGIALDRGDLSEARRLVERANELEPSGLSALIVEAEIALAGCDREQSRAAIDRALKTITANPFAVCDADTARLEERFAELDAANVAG